MELGLKGKAVLVTGASGGIGSAIARMFAQEGCSVAVAYYRNDEAANALVRNCLDLGVSSISVQVDVCNEESVRVLAKTALDAFDRIDVLVNNAGAIAGMSNSPIAEMPVEHWESIFKTNMTGTFLCTKAIAPHMKERGWGRIINISSIHALSGGRVGISNYAAVKGAVLTFTKAAAKEFGRYGITANAIIPGFIAAGMSERLRPELRAAIIAQNPMHRLGTAEEVAALAVWLGSTHAGYINGQFLGCDGGRSDYDLQ
jgi:3-oxoacyl-[acyl-carrier protein] reductase